MGKSFGVACVLEQQLFKTEKAVQEHCHLVSSQTRVLHPSQILSLQLDSKLRCSGLESKSGPRGSKGSMSVDLVIRLDLVLTEALRFFYVTSVVEDSTTKDGAQYHRQD